LPLAPPATEGEVAATALSRGQDRSGRIRTATVGKKQTPEGRKMGNGEQPGSGGRSDWPVRLAGAVGAALGATVGLLLSPVVHLGWLWGAVAFGALVGLGILLGQVAGSLLFRRPPGK
jgi:hypothetical protein